MNKLDIYYVLPGAVLCCGLSYMLGIIPWGVCAIGLAVMLITFIDK